MCNNVIEFANSSYDTYDLSSATISSITARMLKALPWYTYLIMTGLNTFASVSPNVELIIWSMTKNGKAFIETNYIEAGTSGLSSIDISRSPLGKLAKGVNIALIAVDLGLNIYDSVQKEYTFAQGITSFTLTAAKDIGLYFFTGWLSKTLGAEIGAKLGATIGASGGIVGMAIGTVLGIGLGILIDWPSTMLIDLIVKNM